VQVLKKDKMANILQIDLLAYFLPIFSLLFIWVISYALLKKTEILGANDTLNIVAATSVAVIFMVTSEAVQLVKEVIPWFIILVVILIMLFSIFMFLGEMTSFKETIGPTVLGWTIIAALSGIFLFAFAKVFGDPVHSIYAGAEETSGGLGGAIGKAVFHPKVLGAVFLLLIAGQAVKLIVNAQKK